MNRNLDALRAFAVLLVVVGHAAAFAGMLGPFGPFRLVTLGGLGVLLFFVHTALVLMQSLEREPGAASFYLRRAFRIYPLAVVAIVAVILTGIPQASLSVGHFQGIAPDAGDVISNLGLVQNFSMRAPILGPTWSLAYEIQMYILLPPLFLLVTSKRRAFLLYAATLVLAFAVARTGLVTLAQFGPCFVSGILAYKIGKRATAKLPAWSWLLFVGALAAAYIGTADSLWKDFGLCLALGLGIPQFKQITFAPLVGAGHYIAKYSYGVYLSHFAALYLAFDRLSGHSFALQLAVFAVLLVALPVVSFHAIEEPCIRLGKWIVRQSARPVAVAA